MPAKRTRKWSFDDLRLSLVETMTAIGPDEAEAAAYVGAASNPRQIVDILVQELGFSQSEAWETVLAEVVTWGHAYAY